MSPASDMHKTRQQKRSGELSVVVEAMPETGAGASNFKKIHFGYACLLSTEYSVGLLSNLV
jgi:hypothetical protein